MVEEEKKQTEEKSQDGEPVDEVYEEGQNKPNPLEDELLRLKAEFDNYQKRTLREKEELKKTGSKNLILKVLPIIDNLELALGNVQEDSDSEFIKGVKMIYSQMIQVLEEEGVEAIEEKGEFNPKLHEAVLSAEEGGEDGQILQVLQKGYMLNKRVLRHAKVKIVNKR